MYVDLIGLHERASKGDAQAQQEITRVTVSAHRAAHRESRRKQREASKQLEASREKRRKRKRRDYAAKRAAQEVLLSRTRAILSSMSREESIGYELKGCQLLTDQLLDVADEDLDPTPVPTGCPGCWQRTLGSMVCMNCPDSEAQKKAMRDELRARPKDRVILR